MLFIRHGLRIASQPGRTAQALRAIPSSWVYFSSSSITAGRDNVGHESQSATTGPTAFSESCEVNWGTDDLKTRPTAFSEGCELDWAAEDLKTLKTEASSANFGQQIAPDHQAQPERRGTTPLTRPQPADEEQTGDRTKSHPSPKKTPPYRLLRLLNLSTDAEKTWGRTRLSPIKKTIYRLVRLFNLSTDVTLADILEGIAQTAPVGRVLHISWDERGSIHYRGEEKKGAFVLFDTYAAAMDLVRLARQQIFLVRGKSVYTTISTTPAFSSDIERADASRVICIRGPRNVEGFSEEGLRSILMGTDRLVQSLGPLGLDAEACITKSLDRGWKSITWRFFSQERQATPILLILRRAFGESLVVEPGHDPCWNEDLYPKGRTITRFAKYLPVPKKEAFDWPSVREDKHISTQKEHKHSAKESSMVPAWVRNQTPREDGQSDQEQDIELTEELYDSRNILLRLDESQEERIAARTQNSRSPKTNTQHDDENDSHEQAQNTKSLSRRKKKASSGSKRQKSPERSYSFEEFFKDVVLPDSHNGRLPES